MSFSVCRMIRKMFLINPMDDPQKLESTVTTKKIHHYIPFQDSLPFLSFLYFYLLTTVFNVY